jgi:hypothetical protein
MRRTHWQAEKDEKNGNLGNLAAAGRRTLSHVWNGSYGVISRWQGNELPLSRLQPNLLWFSSLFNDEACIAGARPIS